MTNTVTINIQNNCGCGCGGDAGSHSNGGDIFDGEWREIPPVGGDDGPPVGYLPATSLSDRQCRVAIFNYWWVYYLTDNLANTTAGQLYINFASSLALPYSIKLALVLMLNPIITGALASLVTFGIDITDVATAPIVGVLSTALALLITHFISTRNITVTKLQDIFSKLPAIQDQLICTLSKGTTENVKEDLAALLVDPTFDLSESQQEYIVLIAGTMSKMLYYTPEWWPSFDTETLSSITANCCGSFTDGTPLLPASTEKCQTSWYLVDKLAQTFNGIQEYYSSFFWPGGDGQVSTGLNPFDSNVAEFYDITQAEIPPYLPYKVLQKASSKPAFYTGLARYFDNQINSFFAITNYFDYNWSNLAAHLATNAATIRAGLAAALDVNDVYDAIYNPLETWLDANVTDTDLNAYMKNAINGLIQPTGSTSDYLNMMFYQDADLASYAASDCDGLTDPAADSPSAQCGDDTAIGTYDFALGQFNWSHGGHICTTLYDPALGEFRGTTWDPGRGVMTVWQDISRNVQSMTVHYRGPVGGTGSISAGNTGNTRQSKAVSGGTGSVTFTNLCIINNTPVFTSGMIANGNDAWIAITAIEFHQ